MRIIIVQRIFPLYRKAIFDNLANKYDLELLLSNRQNDIKQTEAPYARKVPSFKYMNRDSAIFMEVILRILRFRPKIVVHEFTPAILSLHLTYLICRLFGIKFVIWGHGYNRNKGFNPKNSLNSLIRYFYLKHCDAVLLYSREAKKYLSKYVSGDKLFVAQNTINTPRLLEIRDRLEQEGKEQIKKRIGINFKYNLVYIGRLLPAKMPEILPLVFKKLVAIYNSNIALHFIGDGPMEKQLKAQVKDANLNNIFFHGAIYDDTKVGEYLFISDIMTMPGYVGLAVNHAFCFDTPVITFKQGPDGPFHSPEIEYLHHAKTGFFAENQDVNDFSDKVVSILDSISIQSEMLKNIKYEIESVCSLRNMVQAFEDCFNQILPNG